MTATNESIEALVRGLQRSQWGRRTITVVDDFGYPEVSVIDAGGCIVVNLPAVASAPDDLAAFGVPMCVGADGATEVLSVIEDRVELSVIDSNGRLLGRDAEQVVSRRVAAATDAREALMASDRDRFAWSANRVKLFPRSEYGERDAVGLPSLMDNQQAAAIAGMDLSQWNLYAAAFTVYVVDHRSAEFFDVLLKVRDRGETLSPAAAVVASASPWEIHSLSDLRVHSMLPPAELEAGLRELDRLGLVQWPAPLPVLLEQLPIASLRNIFGPQGIKAQGKAQLVQKAVEVLGEDGLESLTADMDIDRERPVFVDEEDGTRWSGTDPRAERLAQLRSRHYEPLIPARVNLPSNARVDDWDDDEEDFADDGDGDVEFDEREPLDLADEEALEYLNGLIGEAVVLARQLLVSPTTREGALESLASGAGVFAAELARAASVDT